MCTGGSAKDLTGVVQPPAAAPTAVETSNNIRTDPSTSQFINVGDMVWPTAVDMVTPPGAPRPIKPPSDGGPAAVAAWGVQTQTNAARPIPQPTPPTLSAAPAYEAPDPTETAAQRLKRLRALRLGIGSTIKTSAQGLASSPLVATPAATAGALKGKLGR